MIDLHCHALPGMDDGPASYAGSLAMARAAAGAGIEVMTATPHIRSDYAVAIDGIRRAVDALNARLHSEGVAVEVAPGAEVSLAKARTLVDTDLEALCLGTGRYVLIESPYGHLGPELETAVLGLHNRGFHPVLAHPERSPAFLRDPGRLRRLVEDGSLCSITASSLSGAFGPPVRSFALELLTGGFAHNVATDSHGATDRPPSSLRAGLEAMEESVVHSDGYAEWLTDSVPRAILAGGPLPSPPSSGLALRPSSEPGRTRLRSRVGSRLPRRVVKLFAAPGHRAGS